MNTAIIKNWSLTTDTSHPFMAPELLKPRLQGHIYNDSRGMFADGMPILTTPIIDVSECETCKTVTTRNTEYTLYPFDIDPWYEREFPGAYEKLGAENKRERID